MHELLATYKGKNVMFSNLLKIKTIKDKWFQSLSYRINRIHHTGYIMPLLFGGLLEETEHCLTKSCAFHE